MQINGHLYKAAGLHAICTKITHRNQGLSSQLIRDVLQWTEKRYDFAILFTGIPEFYEKLSFQRIQEYRFHLMGKHPKGTKSLRPVVSPQDNALFLSCFSNRAPLSNRLWVKEDGEIAAFNALFATYPTYWSLHYSDSINGIISFEIREKTLHLYDVIGEEIPSLDLILDHLPTAIDDIYFYFSPDRLTNAALPEEYLYDHSHFMMHGNWPSAKPFMIPPLSRC
jgi:hypothetical protein